MSPILSGFLTALTAGNVLGDFQKMGYPGRPSRFGGGRCPGEYVRLPGNWGLRSQLLVWDSLEHSGAASVFVNDSSIFDFSFNCFLKLFPG